MALVVKLTPSYQQPDDVEILSSNKQITIYTQCLVGFWCDVDHDEGMFFFFDVCINVT